MRRAPLIGTLVMLAALGAGCGGGGDDSPDEVRANLSEELQASLPLDEEEADCFAEVLVEEIGVEALQDIDFTAEEPPERLEEDFTAAALVAVDDCDISMEELGS